MALREIGASLTADASSFTSQLKAADSELAILSKQLKATEAEFKAGGDAQEYMTQKEALLAAQTAQSAEKVDALSKAYDEVSGELPRLANAAAEAAAKFGENSAEAQAAAKAYRSAEVESDRLAKRLADARTQYANATAAAQQHAAAEEEAASSMGATGQVSELLSSALDGATGAFLQAGSAAASLTGASVRLAGQGLKLTAQGVAALTAGAITAAGALGALAISGIKTVTDYAMEAAQEGGKWGKPYREFSKDLKSLDKATAGAKAALGGVLLPMLEGLSKDGAAFLNDFSKAMTDAEGDTEKIGAVMGEYIGKGAKLISEKLPEYIRLGSELARSLGSGLQENLPEILEAGTEVLTTLLQGIQDAAPLLGDAGLEIVMTLLDFLLANAPGLLTAGMDMLTKVIEGLTEAGPQLNESAVEIVSALLGYLIENAPQLLTAGVQLLTSVISGISADLPALIPQAIAAVKTLLSALIENSPLLITSGLEMILAIVSGLIDNIPALLTAAVELLGQLLQTLLDNAGSFADTGKEIVDKIMEGVAEAWDTFVGWVSDLWEGLKSIFSGGISTSINATYNGPDYDHGFVGAGTYASGLDYVPYDMFPAYLHKGEAVLPAPQADAWRSGQGSGKTVNLYIYPQTLDETQMQMVVQVVNEELGKDVS